MAHKFLRFLSLCTCLVAAQIGASIGGSSQDVVNEAGPDSMPAFLRVAKTDPSDSGFIATRRALLRKLENANPSDRESVLLELAKLSLHEGLAIEGLSYIATLIAANDTPDTGVSYNGIAAALAVIEPFSNGVSDSELEALETSSSVPFGRVFLATAQAMTGRKDAAIRLISASTDQLDSLPSPLSRKVLPTLLETAIDVEDWEAARALTEQFLKREALRESDALGYLLGRIALHHGEDLRAFDHYLEAAGGRNVWSHRARLAIVDLAIANESLPPADIQAMLSTVYSLWQGDAEAVKTLERKLSLAMQHDDWLVALNVAATVLRSYPNTGVADRALGAVEASLASFYGAGRNGDVPFVEFLSGHRQIARNFRFIEGYDKWSETFADHVLALGAIGMAAAEYRNTREYLEASDKLGIFDVHAQRLAVLKLKEAEARLDAGQMERAETLLRYEDEGADADYMARLGALRARYSELTGQKIRDNSNADAHSAAYIRLLARQQFADQDWVAARALYLKLVRVLGPELEHRDAVELILAAHRSGDEELTRVLGGIIAQRYDLAKEALGPELALDHPIPLELRREIAEASLSRAERVIKQVVELSNQEISGTDVGQD